MAGGSPSFNPHTHAGCDSKLLMNLRNSFLFQSTHPRRVWPREEWIDWTERWFQSTHPRRVWLQGTVPYDREIKVSIHTPTQGVTSCPSIFFRLEFVSIHTPTQGVTNMAVVILFPFCFNPHTHAGCDYCDCSNSSRCSSFQSTHPRRVWPICLQCIYVIQMFQSTHPRRVWQFSRWSWKLFWAFQSTHPRRVWLSLLLWMVWLMKFQSTHPRRVWH